MQLLKRRHQYRYKRYFITQLPVMKEKIRLQLPQPCHENWDAMTPADQGRYCGACCKTVVDFSVMSDREIIDYVSRKADGNTCARVQEAQLDRILQTPPERTPARKYFWSLLVSSLLLSYRSIAQQVKPSTGKPSQEQSPVRIGKMATGRSGSASTPATFELHGRVVNTDGHPVPFATVTLSNPFRQVAADSAGNYVISTTNELDFDVSVSAAGYEAMAPVKLDPKQINQLEVLGNTVKTYLKDFVLTEKKLKEVVITAYSQQALTGVAGAMSFVRKYTVIDKVKRTAEIIACSNNIKVYPNPIPANGTFTMQFNLKQAGSYTIQFMDAGGRIVSGRQLDIVSTGQTESFDSNGFGAQGVYFARVAGRDGKAYNAKLVLQ